MPKITNLQVGAVKEIATAGKKTKPPEVNYVTIGEFITGDGNTCMATVAATELGNAPR